MLNQLMCIIDKNFSEKRLTYFKNELIKYEYLYFLCLKILNFFLLSFVKHSLLEKQCLATELATDFNENQLLNTLATEMATDENQSQIPWSLICCDQISNRFLSNRISN
jgi:hypothetical protein